MMTLLSFLILFPSFFLYMLCNDVKHCYRYDTVPTAAHTGGQVVLSEVGFNEYIQAYIPNVEELITELVIPDVFIDNINLGIASVSFNISNIAFRSVSFESGSVGMSDPYVSVTVADAAGEIDFNWSYTQGEWPYIHDEGWGSATLDDLSIMISGSSTLNEDCAMLQVSLLPIQLSVEDLDITLHGGASWLYDLVLELLTDVIVDYLIDPLAELLHDPIEEGINEAISGGSPIQAKGGDYSIALDLRLTQNPVFGDSVLIFSSVVMFEPADEAGDWLWNQTMPELPPITSDAAAQIYYSMPVFESQFLTFKKLDKLQGWITIDNIADEYASLLSTDFLVEFLPGLSQYPSESVSLFLNVTERPTVVSQPVALFLNLTGTLDMHVDSVDTPLLSLDISWGYTLDPSMYIVTKWWSNNTCLQLDARVYNQSQSVTDSLIGEVEMTEDLIDLVGLLGSSTESFLTYLTKTYTACLSADFVTTDQYSLVIRDEWLQIDFFLL
eukprot:gnl/Dysnectes_brevis/1561_a1771_1775.p1 GENE.gnl/Dysnectes_brevis/1561_a1771_1775~~gnl/Dysnectes_brevis/1561_a1771_1775.p1  ORF type:complete len:519 (+),score=94.63 gnl/Dysnectes_brevis/1561_a1771_1775:66-1559(+)